MNQGLEMIKSVYEDKQAEINGRKYDFMAMTHKKRLKVFSSFMTWKNQLENQDFAFMCTDQFDLVSGIIDEHVAFDGMQLSKLPKHWERFPEDYLMFTLTAIQVISYPFLKGNLGS